ncbi:MAG: phosphoribosylanthranilate isomerase [Sulfurospirillum sp.]|nr:phosphoribosylanthranilate isomerase [Sulfurospirillum sp.]
MLKVKICGITNLSDALACVHAGADALGFVFYKKSPRYIEPHIAAQIVQTLPPFVQKVGLFVDASSEEINLTCKLAHTDIAQIHFEPTQDFYDKLEVAHLKVIRATCKRDILRYEDQYRLVDAFVPSFGGEGKRVDLDFFAGIDCSKIILAGGLNSNNLASITSFGFYGVDVSSGVEASKGKKDHIKVREFITKAKYANT